jgi:hypothetical protein
MSGLCKVVAYCVTEKIGVVAKLHVCIREVQGYPKREFSL